MASFYMHQGDTPTLQRTILDANGNALLIQGATVTIQMTPAQGGPTISHVVTNNDDGTTPNKGKISYVFVAADTSALPMGNGTCVLNVDYKIVYSGGATITAPAPGYDTIRVDT